MEGKNYTIADRFRSFYPVIVDVETAGLVPQTDALLEISMMTVKMDENGLRKRRLGGAAARRAAAISSSSRRNCSSKSAAALEGAWKAVEGATAAEKAAMRFFKVVVEVQ